jgi:tetratricopeptide (TPR) repeat protein/pimeloyl-ACP methyl ester carboxylesterase
MADLSLHPINDSKPSHCVDVVFVHGIGGDPFTTWCPAGRDDKGFWPAWLAEDFAQARIWTLGYPAGKTRWNAENTSMSLPNRALSVLHYVVASGLGERPLIFIAHSLGGLVVKQLLRRANDSTSERLHRCAHATRAAVFLATPHLGARVAEWADTFRVFTRPGNALRGLVYNDDHLNDLRDWFSEHAVQHSWKVLAFRENWAMKAGPLRILVVDAASASHGIPGTEPIPVDADHVSICRLKDKGHPVYVEIKAFLNGVFADLKSDATPPESLPRQTPPGAARPFCTPHSTAGADRGSDEIVTGALRNLAGLSAEGKILVLIADFDAHREHRITIEERILEAIFKLLSPSQCSEVVVKRTRGLTIPEGDCDRATVVAAQTGAALVIWGWYDEAGIRVKYAIRPDLPVEVQAPTPSEVFLQDPAAKYYLFRGAADQMAFVAAFTLGQAFYWRLRYEEAEAFFQQAVDIGESVRKELEAYFQQAIDGGESARIDQNALAAAYFYWAYVLATQKGETQAGCDRFRRALELVPGMLHARYNLGDALLHLGEVQPAIHTFTECLELDPEHQPSRVRRADARLRDGDFKGAVEDYTLALKQGASTRILLSRAEAYLHLEDGPRALEDTLAAKRLDPVSDTVDERLGTLAIKYGRKFRNVSRGPQIDVADCKETALRIMGQPTDFSTSPRVHHSKQEVDELAAALRSLRDSAETSGEGPGLSELGLGLELMRLLTAKLPDDSAMVNVFQGFRLNLFPYYISTHRHYADPYRALRHLLELPAVKARLGNRLRNVLQVLEGAPPLYDHAARLLRLDWRDVGSRLFLPAPEVCWVAKVLEGWIQAAHQARSFGSFGESTLSAVLKLIVDLEHNLWANKACPWDADCNLDQLIRALQVLRASDTVLLEPLHAIVSMDEFSERFSEKARWILSWFESHGPYDGMALRICGETFPQYDRPSTQPLQGPAQDLAVRLDRFRHVANRTKLHDLLNPLKIGTGATDMELRRVLDETRRMFSLKRALPEIWDSLYQCHGRPGDFQTENVRAIMGAGEDIRSAFLELRAFPAFKDWSEWSERDFSVTPDSH